MFKLWELDPNYDLGIVDFMLFRRDTVDDFLPSESHGIVNDLGLALATVVPLTPEVGAITLTSVGILTGLDGSGFSGISLAGSSCSIVFNCNWGWSGYVNRIRSNCSNLGWRWYTCSMGINTSCFHLWCRSF